MVLEDARNVVMHELVLIIIVPIARYSDQLICYYVNVLLTFNADHTLRQGHFRHILVELFSTCLQLHNPTTHRLCPRLSDSCRPLRCK